MKILLTGATGFIGRQLVPALLAAGHEVSVLVRRGSRLEACAWREAVSLHEGDLLKPETLAPACAGNSLVIHLAALAHVTNTSPDEHWQHGYRGSANLLSAARSAGIKRFIYLSSIKASAADNASAYGQSKAAVEKLLRQAEAEHGLQPCILRTAVVYGCGMKGNLAGWIRKCRQGLAPPLPQDCARLRMIGVQDLCAAIVHLLDTGAGWGLSIGLDDGRDYALKDIETAIHRALGKTPPRWYLPRRGWWLAGKMGDIGYRLLGINMGFSSRSWQSLFENDEPDPTLATMPPDFVIQQDFYRQLPEIVADPAGKQASETEK